MSKWFDKKNFEKFAKKQKEVQEKEEASRENLGKNFPKYSKPFNVTYVLRFLPAIKDKNPAEFFRKMFFHLIKTTDGWKYITCLWTYNEKNCPLCKVSTKLYSSKEREDNEVANGLRRQTKWIANVYVIDDPRDKRNDTNKITGSVRVLSYKTQVEKKVRNASDTESETGIGASIIDPEEGYDFHLKVVENKTPAIIFPNYEESEFSRKPSSLAKSEKEIKAILDKVYSLDEYLEDSKTSVDEMLKALEEALLIEHLEDYEIQRLSTKSEKKIDSKKTEEVEKEKESIEDTENETEEVENEEKEKEDEEDSEFLKELDALDFDEDE